MASEMNSSDDDMDPIQKLLMLNKLEQEDDNDQTHENPNLELDLQHHPLPSLDSTIFIRQLRSQGLSFQLWPAAKTLLSLLNDHRSDNMSTSPLSSTLLESSSTSTQMKILEIGSGTGLVGIAAAAVLGALVVVTDLPNVLPNLQFNVDANSDLLVKCVIGASGDATRALSNPITQKLGHGGDVRVAALSWGEPEDVKMIGDDFDLIVASDVVYHDHLYDPLIKTLRLLFEQNKKKMVFVMAHMRRWKKETVFFRKARKFFDVEVMHKDQPRPGSRIGVVVYRFDWKCKNMKAHNTQDS